MKTLQSRRGLYVILAVVAGSCMAHAKVRFFTLVEKTRSAPLILVGTVAELRNGSILVTTEQVLKGAPSPTPVEVRWDRNGNLELPSPSHHAGDKILLFANNDERPIAPLAGPQGVLTLKPGWAEDYVHAIRRIIQFDIASTSEAKTISLVTMLKMDNRLAQLSAMEITYLEYHKRVFQTAPLLKPVTALAQGPDREVAIYAIQLLSRVGDAESVAVLIELLASKDNQIAERAYLALKRMTRAELPFDSHHSSVQKNLEIKKWQDWWAANKERVLLLR